MNCRSFKEIREDAEAILKEGINNKEALFAALPVLVELAVKCASMRQTLRAIGEVGSELNDAASEYALAHRSVFEGGLITDGKGVQHGDVEVGGKLYHFAAGYGKPVRRDGDNLTQEFLAALPEKWIKGKIELDVTGMARLGVTNEELAAAGLIRTANNVWSLPAPLDL